MGEVDEFWWRWFRRMATQLVRQGPLVARYPLPGGGRLLLPLPLLIPSLLLLLLTGLLLGLCVLLLLLTQMDPGSKGKKLIKKNIK
jgi:hypothetical protein